MTDFSKSLFYCSSLSIIMGNGRSEKSMPSNRLLEANIELAEMQSKYDPAATKYVNRHEARKRNIEELKIKIEQIKLLKDEDFIPDRCKVYLSKFYGYLKYGKFTVPAGTPFMPIEKGNLVEVESIKLLSRLDNRPYEKNEQRFTNVYLSGIPDIIVNDYIIDVKSSYDADSFFRNLHGDLSDVYFWQMQGYFYLTGIRSGEVSFCLVETPKAILDKIIADILSKNNKYTESELRSKFSYDDIPEEDRRIKFLVERDDEAISKIPERINNCRKFLAYLEEQRKVPRIATRDLLSQTETTSLEPDAE